MGDFVNEKGFGALFVNRKREGKQPNSSGTFTAPFDIKEGDVVAVAAWVKESENPSVGKYQSLRISKPYVKEEKKVDAGFGDMSDDIPF
jgi:hypothetical protein